jgi:hypothetical protein
MLPLVESFRSSTVAKWRRRLAITAFLILGSDLVLASLLAMKVAFGDEEANAIAAVILIGLVVAGIASVCVAFLRSRHRTG